MARVMEGSGGGLTSLEDPREVPRRAFLLCNFSHALGPPRLSLLLVLAHQNGGCTQIQHPPASCPLVPHETRHSLSHKAVYVCACTYALLIGSASTTPYSPVHTLPLSLPSLLFSPVSSTVSAHNHHPTQTHSQRRHTHLIFALPLPRSQGACVYARLAGLPPSSPPPTSRCVYRCMCTHLCQYFVLSSDAPFFFVIVVYLVSLSR